MILLYTHTHCTFVWLHFLGSDNTQARKSWADHFSAAAQSNCWAKTKRAGSRLCFFFFFICPDLKCFFLDQLQVQNILRQHIQAIFSTAIIKMWVFCHWQPKPLLCRFYFTASFCFWFFFIKLIMFLSILQTGAVAVRKHWRNRELEVFFHSYFNYWTQTTFDSFSFLLLQVNKISHMSNKYVIS